MWAVVSKQVGGSDIELVGFEKNASLPGKAVIDLGAPFTLWVTVGLWLQPHPEAIEGL